ncbi:hypothetical protein GmHk_10G028232 [Glycine max]|nr:hypothetical protein GmHk_10G028232 [Glycine max]
MSRKENLISKLHTKKGTWKIVVRIIDMWHVNKHNGRQTIEMVLMDQMGAKIGTTLWQELFPEFEPKLHCGCAYLIQNIKVVDNHSEYKVSTIPFLVYLVKTTDVEIIMTMWEEYALHLDDAIEKNHFVRKPLVVMLTLAKIKDPKGHFDEPSIGKSPAVGAETSSQDYQPTSADYDLGKTVFVAPTKRMYDQQGNSEFEFDEYTSYQLLTNKHIKAE